MSDGAHKLSVARQAVGISSGSIRCSPREVFDRDGVKTGRTGALLLSCPYGADAMV